ncbi:MAG: hypothetical protein MJZ25_04950 [Fibrobacter sp.]|nr:hypothetical protein [Fibrobacter sp.]
MNFKIITLVSALAFTAAVAQDDEDDYEDEEEETTEEVAESKKDSSPAPVVPEMKEAPKAEAKGLDVLHGNAYNLVGNEGGAATIGSNMASLYKMAGSNLIYIEPSGEQGVLALTMGGITFFGGLSNSNVQDSDVGILTVGASLGAMGFGLDFGIDKNWHSEETNNNESSTSTYGAGDIMALKFGMNFGALDLAANLFWVNFADEEDTETAAQEITNDRWDLGLSVTVSNSPVAKNIFWSAGLGIMKRVNTTETEAGNNNTEVTHEDDHLLIQPNFNVAFPIFSNENSQVLAGLNTRLPLRFYDVNDRFTMELYTSPNVLAEIVLNENWILSAGATYDWCVFGHSGAEQGNTDISDNYMKTSRTMANAGVRFNYKNLIVEATVADALGSSAWAGLVGQLGLFLTF